MILHSGVARRGGVFLSRDQHNSSFPMESSLDGKLVQWISTSLSVESRIVRTPSDQIPPNWKHIEFHSVPRAHLTLSMGSRERSQLNRYLLHNSTHMCLFLEIHSPMVRAGSSRPILMLTSTPKKNLSSNFPSQMPHRRVDRSIESISRLSKVNETMIMFNQESRE